MEGSAAITSKKSRNEEQDSTDTNDQMTNNVHVHGTRVSNEIELSYRWRNRTLLTSRTAS